MTSDAPPSGRLDGREHRLPVRVYYEDTDFTGRVYHARYLQFLERGRSDFLRTLGVVHADLLERPEPVVFAVTAMTLRFHAGAGIDDALVVRSRFVAASGVRFTMEQEVMRGKELLVSAVVEAVSMSPDGRPRRAPKEAAAAIRRLLPPPNEGPEGVPK